ncbi:Proline iminopeptidase [Fulvia fulva]|uniref:Proline iminopeptidase n=1 Tax=Passalora fulva TaxID=5499 RepID=A0A9Q8UW01_PASFU|nr:Proline iminopeptidase [Fulvia fulva]UJO24506.1 Proline iminopeptidase [Fulvia fulva]WPV22005.1 Proline iminopeptidase [Fulvia fulva]WPV36873.1 Proline iminopeptidase [Fulvia fulva]
MVTSRLPTLSIQHIECSSGHCDRYSSTGNTTGVTMGAGYQHPPAWDSGHLPVGEVHRLYYEQYGQHDGKPVIFLHGGPGGSTAPDNAAFFDPDIYRVVLFDQRGCGKSTPHAELRENTTWHLVADIEALKAHLGITKWHVVFGGSWGSTLALAYSQTHPTSCGSLVLRGIFAMRKVETDFMFEDKGVAMIYPELWDRFVSHLKPEARSDPRDAYLRLMTADDPAVSLPAAKLWNTLEMSVSRVEPAAEDVDKVENDAWGIAHARLEAHYFVNGGFMQDGDLLKEENVEKIRHIPCSIVQGRLDLVCPARTAWELHQLLPQSKLYMIPVAGHSAKEPGTYSKLIEVCDAYAKDDF